MSTYQGFNSKALHEGFSLDNTKSRAIPIYQTSSYIFDNTEHAANLFALKEFGNIYTRIMNPTNDVLEKRIAALEGGVAALTFSSGSAAITGALLTILKNGDEIVSSSSLYGGTYNLFQNFLPRLGIQTHFVAQEVPENFRLAITEKTKAIYIETIGNPKIDIPDFKVIADIAKEAGIPLIVDNTIASPYLFNPIQFGANIVIHSLTKYIGGHGNSIGGIVVDGGNFDWTNGRFPEFTAASPFYHGLSYSETFGNIAYIIKARVETLRDTGAALSPFNAFLFIQGLDTLSLRLKQHSENALKVAEFLENHPQVEWVYYPGLASSPYHELAKKYLPNGQSSVISFGIRGDYTAAKQFVNETRLFSLLANIGDTKSLIIHPASTTHQQLNESQQRSAGVAPELIRLSVGLEDIQDIINDLDQAFLKVKLNHAV